MIITIIVFSCSTYHIVLLLYTDEACIGLCLLFCRTADHTKFIGSFKTSQNFIDVVEVVYRGAMKGKVMVTSPLDPLDVPKYSLLYKDV